MIVYLAGSDSYLAWRAIKALKEKYRTRNPQGYELKEIDSSGQAADWVDLRANPLFSSSRLIIIKRAGWLKVNEQKNLAACLSGLSPTTVVAIWDDKPIGNQQLLGELKNAAKQVSVAPLTGGKLTAWISSEAAKIGVGLGSAEIQDLADRFLGDLWAVTTELKTWRSSQEVRRSAWRKSRELSPPDLFSLLRRQAWPEIKMKIRQAYLSGSPIELIIGLVASGVRQAKLSPQEKRPLVSLLADLDIAVKTGLLDQENAFALLIAHLPNPDPSRLQWEQLWVETASS